MLLADLPPGSWTDRLLTKIDLDPQGCWLWTASCRKDGYGQIWKPDGHGGRTLLSAHRAVYELALGPIPDGLDLDHLCRVRLCVRPDHLEPVTRRENVLRGEGHAARNARRTTCLRGHSLVQLRPGHRGCPICRAAPRNTAPRHAA